MTMNQNNWIRCELTILAAAFLLLAPLSIARAAFPAPDTNSLRLAIEDLSASFPAQYTRGAEFLGRLDSATNAADLAALQREALLANPLLDFDRVLAVKRIGASGLPANFHSNSSLPMTGYNNCVIEFSIHGKTPERVVFTPPDGRFVGDLCLHFDGSRFLFTMPNEHDWQVHEVQVAGTGLRQVTPDIRPGIGNYDACYLPDGDVLFTSTLCMSSVPCVAGGAHVANLCRLNSVTGKVRQLCFDQEHNWCPRVMPNGTVLYQRWEYTDTPHSNTRLLMTMNPDGTNQREFYGSNSYWPAAFFYATPIPGTASQVIGVSSGHHGDHRVGELYILDPALGRREDQGVVRQIPANPTTPSGKGKIYDHMLNVWPRFLHPCPLSAKYYLVACQPSPKHPWGIYLVDVFDNFTLLKECNGAMMFEPLALVQRPVPPVIPHKVKPERRDSIIYIADIYAGGGLRGIPRGTVKALRVSTYVYSYHGVGGLLGVIGADGPWDVRRVLGTVAVNSDGSAKFRVPANTPISVQPLDGKGQALALMRSWMTPMPGEVLSCVGCHEDPGMSPPVQGSIAFTQEPVDLTPWRTAGTGFAYEREVQPVLDRRCVACHGSTPLTAGDGRQAPPDLRGGIPLKDWSSRFAGNGGGRAGKFSTSYANLFPFVRNNGIEGDYHLLSPMEFHFQATELGQMLRKGHHGVELNADDFSRLVTWADMNRPYHGSWASIVGTNFAERSCEARAENLQAFAGLDDPYREADLPAAAEDRTPVMPAQQPAIPVPANLPPWAFDASQATTRQAQCGAQELSLDLGEGQALTLVRIPAGKFVMGSTDGHRDEHPVSIVEIGKPFWMARYETSNAQFRRFDATHDSRVMDALSYQFGQRPWSLNGETQPVCRVSFLQAAAFCEWLARKSGKRVTLPTEAQWEWACRAGTETAFSFGGSTSLTAGGQDADYTSFANLGDRSLSRFATETAHAGYHGMALISNPSRFDDWIPKDEAHDDGSQLSAAPGSYRANAFGLFDMHGNVAEWTRSPYRPYPYRDENALPSEERVVRGGSWYDRPQHCTSSYRVAYQPYQPVFNVGFRVVCEE
jgi:formylglycine-generating enzyme required for sulfatase activity